jgi:hypothetical protein
MGLREGRVGRDEKNRSKYLLKINVLQRCVQKNMSFSLGAKGYSAYLCAPYLEKSGGAAGMAAVIDHQG